MKTLRNMTLGLLTLAITLCIVPDRARATTVTAVLCAVNTWPCPAGAVIDSGVRNNGVNLLGANRYATLPFTFNDAISNFTGTIMVTDSRGIYTYLWGGGVGTDKTGAAMFLDVAIGQNYVTAPGPAAYSEFNRGGCNAAATAAGAFTQATVQVNATPFSLPVMTGLCPAFNVAGGPAFGLIGAVTNLTALAQFDFLPGAPNQQMNLPWGEDDPDPSLKVFPDPNNIPAGFRNAATPEPSEALLLGGALALMGAFRYRGARSKQQ